MKIYSIDFSVYGCVLVVANSKEEAIEKMKYKHECCHEKTLIPDRITEHEINEDFVYVNMGDL